MAVTQKRDFYDVLGVSRDSSPDEIKRAYRKSAMKYHPDRGSDDPDTETKFKEAAEAYEVLSNPETRSRYDHYGHAGLSGTTGHDMTTRVTIMSSPALSDKPSVAEWGTGKDRVVRPSRP